MEVEKTSKPVTTVEETKKAELELTLTTRVEGLIKKIEKAERNNGFIGKAWSGIKDLFNTNSSIKRVKEIHSKEEQLLADLKNGSKKLEEVFQELTGAEVTENNIEQFLKGEIKLESEKVLESYIEGQEMTSDVVGDIVSGIAALGIYTAAVAAAPFSGGASIAVGFAAATAAGAGIKAGIKALDTIGADKQYTTDNLKHDLATGAFSGALAPVTGGLGGAVGKGIATKFGIEAVKQVGKKVAEGTVATGVKQTVKTALTNPAGYKYTGGSAVKRATALGAEMMTDGAAGGAIDNAFRTAYDGGSLEDIGNSAVEGFVGGAILSPVIGGGMKLVGKGTQKIFGKNNVHIDADGNIIRTDVIADLLNNKIDIDYAAAVLRDIDDLNRAFEVAELHIPKKDRDRFYQIKDELIKKINKNIMDHGSIVLQTEIPAERFVIDNNIGVRYAKATQDDIVLAHAVQNDRALESLTYLVNAAKKYDDNNYLSLSLINKNSNLFGDETEEIGKYAKYGIIPDVKNKNITSAGFGQVSEYKKDFATFVHHYSLSDSPEEYVYLKHSLLNKLKENGYNLSNTDYVQLFNLLKNKKYFNEITEDININGIVINADILRNSLEESSIDLSVKFMYGCGSNNEVSAIIDGIKAIYARVDNIEEIAPEIIKLAKNNELDIVLLGKPHKGITLEDIPDYQSELNILKLKLKNKDITMQTFLKKRDLLVSKYKTFVSQYNNDLVPSAKSYKCSSTTYNHIKNNKLFYDFINTNNQYIHNKETLIKLRDSIGSQDCVTKQMKSILTDFINKLDSIPQEKIELFYEELRRILSKLNSVHPEQISDAAFYIHTKAGILRSSINNWKEQTFIENGLLERNNISMRIKGDSNLSSLENKILREMVNEHQAILLKAIQEGDYNAAYDRIFDLCGTRICFNVEKELATILNILGDMVKNRDFAPEYIANIYGTGIKPILSEQQFSNFVSLCTKEGYPNIISGNRIDESGYTGFHANGKLNNLQPENSSIPIEIQIRPRAINEILDIIHIAYDVFNNKEILEGISGEEYNRLKVFVDGFKDLKENGRKNDYYTYQIDYINASLQGLPLPSITEVKYNLSGYEFLSLDEILDFKRWQVENRKERF